MTGAFVALAGDEGSRRANLAAGQDVAERERQEEARAFLAAAMASTEDAVIGTDLAGTITRWNAGAERLYGYTSEEVVGRNVALLGPPERPDEIPSILQRLKQGERIAHHETERVRKNGGRVHVSVNVWPVRDQQGEVVGAAAVTRDVTTRRGAEAERERLLALAEEAVRERNAVVAMVTHDLRHVLTLLLLRAAMLRELVREGPTDPDRVVRLADQLDSSARRMGRMLQELADTARLEAGQPLQLERQPTDLVALARERVAEAQEAWPERRWVLDVAAPTLTGDWDPERLARLLDNLLQNAGKYSPAGGPIRLSLSRNGDWGVLVVADEGMGIPPVDLPRVFERNHRGSNVNGQVRGTGLGLWGAREIAWQHGGTLAAESAGEGQGSTFTLRLPLT